MKFIAIILAALSLSACAGQNDGRSDTQRTLDTLNIAYMVAAVSIDACVAAAVPPCDKPEVVVQIKNGEAAVYAALVGAEAIVKAADSDAAATEKTLAIVRSTLTALTAILSQYGIRAEATKR